jgi:hypothetical protein
VAELFQPFLNSSYQIRIGADITLKEKEKKKNFEPFEHGSGG